MGEEKNVLPRLMLDASVVLNPVAFAVHLAAFSSHEQPVGVPVAWLWEELDRRYALLTLADVIGWLRSDLDRCLNEPLGSDQYAAPTASLAMLFAARRLGLIVPVATTHSIKFFESADWASYLSDALGPDWEEIGVSEHQGQTAWTAAVKVIAREKGMAREDLEHLYARNRDFSTSQTHEYPTYERLRSLSVVTLELLAGLCSRVSVSTPSPRIRNLIAQDCAMSEGIFIAPTELPLQPLIEQALVRNPRAKVRDALGVVGIRDLALLLGGAEELSEAIAQQLNNQRLAKDMGLYLLGLIPVVGNVATAVEGAELIRDLWKRATSDAPASAESLLYFSAAACTVRS